MFGRGYVCFVFDEFAYIEIMYMPSSCFFCCVQPSASTKYRELAIEGWSLGQIHDNDEYWIIFRSVFETGEKNSEWVNGTIQFQMLFLCEQQISWKLSIQTRFSNVIITVQLLNCLNIKCLNKNNNSNNNETVYSSKHNCELRIRQEHANNFGERNFIFSENA